MVGRHRPSRHAGVPWTDLRAGAGLGPAEPGAFRHAAPNPAELQGGHELISLLYSSPTQAGLRPSTAAQQAGQEPAGPHQTAPTPAEPRPTTSAQQAGQGRAGQEPSGLTHRAPEPAELRPTTPEQARHEAAGPHTGQERARPDSADLPPTPGELWLTAAAQQAEQEQAEPEPVSPDHTRPATPQQPVEQEPEDPHNAGPERVRSRRPVLRRVAVPAAAGAVLLAAAVAMAAAGPAAVAGSPTAGAVAPGKRALANARPAPEPAPTSTPTAPQPPPPVTEAPKPAATQPVNSVRLVRGGTATLIPMEVVNGVLPVPEGVREAAWWGATLDATGGATVLAGHVNWRGATGPFSELWQSNLGDLVSVIDQDGRVFQFRVSQLVTVHKNDLPARAQELFGQDGAHRLVLVTCGGRWVGGHDGYEENRVVIAEPI